MGLRVTITGHASPRWKSAKNATEADRRNEQLSKERADKALALVKCELGLTLPESIPIEINVSKADSAVPTGVEVGSMGQGSRETLKQYGGDRKSNQEYARRVDLDFQLFTTTTTKAGKSLKPQSRSAKTFVWSLTVTRFDELSFGPATEVSLEILLKNGISGKTQRATSTLYGAGGTVGGIPSKRPKSLKPPKPLPTPWSDRSEKPFLTADPVGFNAFDDAVMRMGRLTVGLDYLYLNFPFKPLSTGMITLKTGLGRIKAYLVFGYLKLEPPFATGTVESPEETEEVEVDTTKLQGEGLIITYPTESSDLPTPERERLTQTIEIWGRRLAPGSSRRSGPCP